MKSMVVIVFAASMLGAYIPAEASLGQKAYIGLAPGLSQQYHLTSRQVAAMRVDRLGDMRPASAQPRGENKVSPYYFMADLYSGNPQVKGMNPNTPHSHAFA